MKTINCKQDLHKIFSATDNDAGSALVQAKATPLEQFCVSFDKNETGFTLVELLITFAIAAILIGIAAPGFQNFIQQVRLTTATNALHTAMNLARMEAIKRNGRVDLIAYGESWKNGWMITAGGQQIINHEALHDDINVSSTFTHNTMPYITYNGTGRTRTATSTNTPQVGTIRLSIGNNSRLIIVNFLGRVRVCNPAAAQTNTCVNTTVDK